VFLKMVGSCSGCSSSGITLKNGIKRTLSHWIPEVIDVVAVSDSDLEQLNAEQFIKTEHALETQHQPPAAQP